MEQRASAIVGAVSRCAAASWMSASTSTCRRSTAYCARETEGQIVIEVLAQLRCASRTGHCPDAHAGTGARHGGGRHGRAAAGAGGQGDYFADVRRVRPCHRPPAGRRRRAVAAVHRAPPPLAERSTKSEIFETGIKAIDVLVPLERGGKAGLFGGAGVGKTVLLTEMIHNMIGHQQGREHLLRHRRALPRRRRALPRHEGSRRAEEHGHGLRPDERTAGQPVPRGPRRADDGRVFPRRRTPRCAAADRQYFPLHSGWHGSVRADGTDAFAARLSAHHGHRAFRVGGAHRQYRAGAITSIQAVYVPADDFTDPAAVHVFSHLSASIVLSRKRASEGLFPAIDPLQSSSKMATPGSSANGITPGAGNPPDPGAVRGSQGHYRDARAWSSFRPKTARWLRARAGWSAF